MGSGLKSFTTHTFNSTGVLSTMANEYSQSSYQFAPVGTSHVSFIPNSDLNHLLNDQIRSDVISKFKSLRK